MDQITAHNRLIAAVVALAIKDACTHTTSERFGGVAREAMDFLFLHGDGYLVLLDMDPQQFRERLIKQIYSEQKDGTYFTLDSKERLRFRNNYKRWFDITSETRIAA